MINELFDICFFRTMYLLMLLHLFNTVFWLTRLVMLSINSAILESKSKPMYLMV